MSVESPTRSLNGGGRGRPTRPRVRDHRLETWKALAARAATVAAQADAPMRDVDQAVRDLKAVLEPQAGGSGGGGESTKGAPPDAIAAELRTSLAALSTRLRELRDAEDWRRWANAGIQEALVGQVEALKSSKDLPNVARQLRDLRRQWKAVSAGRRRIGRALAALQERRRRAAGALRRAGAPGRGRAGRPPRGARGAVRIGRGPGPVHRLGDDRRDAEAAAGAVGAPPARRRATRSPSWRAASAPPATRSSRAARPISPRSSRRGPRTRRRRKRSACRPRRSPSRPTGRRR